MDFLSVIPARFRTAILVTLLTALIWVVAEGQSVQSRSIEVAVRLQAAAADLAVTVTQPGWTGLIELEVTGSNAALDTLDEAVRSGIDLQAGVEFSADPGARTIQVLDALRQAPGLRDTGVTLNRAEPPVIPVLIERLTTIELPIRVEAPEGSFAEPPEVEPPTVAVQMTEDDARRLSEESEALVAITPDRLRGLPRGQSQRLRNLPITRPIEVRGRNLVTLDPASVDVTVRLRDLTRSVLVERVPVSIRSSSAVYNEFDVDLLDPFLADVTVSGPGDTIDRLPTDDDGRIVLTATVSLGADELERAAADGVELNKPVLFSDLPTDLSFQTPGAPAGGPTVRLRVQRRPEPAPAEPSPAASAPEPGQDP